MNTNDDTETLTEHAGAEALDAAASAERAARAGGEDPLAELAARVAAEGDSVAFAPAAVDAATTLRDDDPAAYATLRSELKRAKGISLTRWEKALDARAKARRVEARERAEREARERSAAAREMLTRTRAEASEATAVAREAAPPDVRPHHAEHTTDDDAATRFVMEPGRITVEHPVKGSRVEMRTLAAFSAAIVADVHEFSAPGVAARRTFDLSVMLPGDTSARAIEGIGADEFRAMQWPETRIGARAVVHDIGRRDALRVAIQSMSTAAETLRFRFTGWHMHQGAPVYLHAGGAIGENGAVAGLRAEAEAPVDRFDLGDLAIAPSRGVAAVVELLTVEPATVVVPLVCAAFRAAMGTSRITLHVAGRTGTGKSLLTGLTQALFGRSFRGDALPASWADGSTANGIAGVLARAGDAVVAVDDLRFMGGHGDVKVAELFDRVTRAQFNGAAPVKRTRDGGQRHDPASRSVILSTGESPPRTHSTRNRVVCVELGERPTPDLEPLMARAAAGELARGMAAFVQWYAPRWAGNVSRLDALERAAALRWNLGVTDHAAGLFGALALGAELLFAWLSESGVSATDVARHEARAREALAAVAREHGEGVEAENPARRFIPLLTEAFVAGEAHVKALRPDGRADAIPPDPDAWGWRVDGDGARHQGKGVGWMRDEEVYIDPGVALDVVRARALREGNPFALDRTGLARDLHAAGLLARTDVGKARARFTTRVRIGAGIQRDVLVFSPATFGASSAGASDDPAAPLPDDHPSRYGAPEGA